MKKNDGLIKIIDLVDAPPYKKFIKLHNEALDKNQIPINAIGISSYDAIKEEVDSRYVNLKYIYCDEWIFFTNYSGPKSEQFKNHNQISAIIYWDSIDVQIRIKANIKKTDKKFSDQHYKNRSSSKNAIAISSKQSAKIDSYESVMKNYKEALENSNISNKRPSYWGGYSFTPYYFEFWEGNKNRINKRQVFEIDDNSWNCYFLQP